MKRVLILLALLLPLFFALHSRGDAVSSAVRLGDLQISAISVGPASMQFDEPTKSARKGYHLLAVEVQVMNAATQPACTEIDPVLETDSGDHYTPVIGIGSFWPQTFNLPANKQSHGEYLFEVKDGQEPATLVLSRDINAEDLCAMAQGRTLSNANQARVKIGLSGFTR